MSSGVQLDAMLARTPEVCGGRLRIDGTRVTVLQIAALYKQGETAEDIGQNFPHLDLSQIYTALAYYHANRKQVDEELIDEEAEFDRLKKLHSPASNGS